MFHQTSCWHYCLDLHYPNWPLVEHMQINTTVPVIHMTFKYNFTQLPGLVVNLGLIVCLVWLNSKLYIYSVTIVLSVVAGWHYNFVWVNNFLVCEKSTQILYNQYMYVNYKYHENKAVGLKAMYFTWE